MSNVLLENRDCVNGGVLMNGPDMWAEVKNVPLSVWEDWISSLPFDHQRHLKDWWVNDLADRMKAGTFRRTSQIVIAHVGHRGYLIDGQHRSHAAVKYLSSPEGKGKTVTVNVLHIRTEDLEKVRYEYAGIDLGIKRGLGDALVALGIQQKTGLSLHEQKATYAAMSLIASGFESPYWPGGKNPSLDDRVRMIMNWVDEAKGYFTTIGASGGRYGQMFRRSAVVAVGLVTFRYQPKAAGVFWERVYKLTDLQDGSPELALNKFLVDHPLNNKAYSSNYCKRISSAWNGFMRKETRRTLKTTIDDAPITIVGTPYSRERVLKDDMLGLKEE